MNEIESIHNTDKEDMVILDKVNVLLLFQRYSAMVPYSISR